MFGATIFIRSSSLERKRARKREAQRKYRRRIRQYAPTQSDGVGEECEKGRNNDVREDAESTCSKESWARRKGKLYKSTYNKPDPVRETSNPGFHLLPLSPPQSCPSPHGTLLGSGTSVYQQDDNGASPESSFLFTTPYHSSLSSNLMQPWKCAPMDEIWDFHHNAPTDPALSLPSLSSYLSTPAESQQLDYSLPIDIPLEQGKRQRLDDRCYTSCSGIAEDTNDLGYVLSQGGPKRRGLGPPSYTEDVTTRGSNRLAQIQPSPYSNADVERGRTKIRPSVIPRSAAKGHLWDQPPVHSDSHIRQSADSKNKNRGLTPLFQAVMLGQLQIVRILIERCKNLNATDDTGQTMLHLAADGGYVEIVKCIVSYSVDLDVRDNEGNTALHLAVANGHEAIVRILVEAGADIELGNHPRR
ncbi:hypothetical protein GGS20DRAFT_38437 [Poronia punctata]|nr:hypothetical protein GGS20DRAFT_38437 [Poronia punctata]